MAKGQVYTCINKPKKGSVVIVFIDLPEHKIKKNTVKRMIKKYYKEQIGSLIQYKIDLNGNIILKQLRGLNKKIQKGMINNLIKIYKKGKTNIVYTFFIKYFFMEKIQEIGEEVEVSEEDKEGLNWVIRIQRGRKKIKEIKEKFLEYKIKNQTKIFNLMSRRTPRVFQKDANTKRIKKNPFYKFQLPGFPNIINKLKRKLKKRLLIQRIRRKYQFLMSQQILALHTFLGTKEGSYASLVKQNKISVLKNIYRYKLRVKAKKRTHFREKKFIKRPLKNLKMNQVRFNIMQEPTYTLWYNKMQEQMLNTQIINNNNG